MKTVAYLRVSTRSQDLATQKLAILEFSQKRRVPVDHFIESQLSSRTSPRARRLEELLETLQPGDRLLVSELSRLGRSLGQVIHIVDTLVQRQIHFIAIKEGIEFDGQQDLRTKVMIALFGLFACEPLREPQADDRERLVEAFAHAGGGTRVVGGQPAGQVLQQAPGSRDVGAREDRLHPRTLGRGQILKYIPTFMDLTSARCSTRDGLVRVEAAGDAPSLTAVRSALEEALGVRFEGEKGARFFHSTLVQTQVHSDVYGPDIGEVLHVIVEDCRRTAISAGIVEPEPDAVQVRSNWPRHTFHCWPLGGPQIKGRPSASAA